MKKISETIVIATSEEMKQTGLPIGKFTVINNLNSLWVEGVEWDGATIWTPRYRVYSQEIISEVSYEHLIDGEIFYTTSSCDEIGQFFVKSTDNRIFDEGAQVFIEDDGLTIAANGLRDTNTLAKIALKYGYKVSEEAFAHNISCWEGDYKSGFLDEESFTFSACGCNPLRFYIEKHNGKDYQKTYYA